MAEVSERRRGVPSPDSPQAEIRLGSLALLLQIEGGLGEVGGLAEVAPVGVVVAEGQDFFAWGGEAEVGVDDGEGAGLGEQGEEARGEDVDAGEG